MAYSMYDKVGKRLLFRNAFQKTHGKITENSEKKINAEKIFGRLLLKFNPWKTTNYLPNDEVCVRPTWLRIIVDKHI